MATQSTVPGEAGSTGFNPGTVGQGQTPGRALRFERLYTTAGVHPFDAVEWEIRDAVIGNERGERVFEQKGVEVPKFWSQTATNVVVSKYFRGPIGTPQRESSVRQLIARVADTIAGWGKLGGYFASDADADAFHAELTHILLHQMACFNSPVWFNVGIEPRPQCSACFINSVDDTMQSILGLAKTEGMLFKYGSGTGSNLSSLRSSREQLAGGGTASGPVSFMKGFDAFAGVIKSGGSRPATTAASTCRAAPTTRSSTRTPTTRCAPPTPSCAPSPTTASGPPTRWSPASRWTPIRPAA
jgi:ribonucleoside-diphosphate reductase alpha chain